MPKITESDFKKQIKNSKINKLYFIYGNEKYLVNYYEKLLLDNLINKKKNSFNYNFFDGENIDINLFRVSTETFPIGSERKCILIRNLNVELLNSKQLDDIFEVLSDIPDICTVIISQTISEVNEKKSSKWKKFIASISKYGDILELNQKTRTSLEKQIVLWAKKREKVLSMDNASEIVEMCGRNLNTLRNEVEKLCALEINQEISIDSIKKIVVRNLDASVFDLCKFLISGNISEAYNCLDALFFHREEPIMILSAIASNYIDMYRVKIAIENKLPASAISDIFDYKGKDFKLKNAERNLKYISLADIRKSMYMILEVDEKLKSSRVESRIMLEELLVKLIKIKSSDID